MRDKNDIELHPGDKVEFQLAGRTLKGVVTGKAGPYISVLYHGAPVITARCLSMVRKWDSDQLTIVNSELTRPSRSLVDKSKFLVNPHLAKFHACMLCQSEAVDLAWPNANEAWISFLPCGRMEIQRLSPDLLQVEGWADNDLPLTSYRATFTCLVRAGRLYKLRVLIKGR